MVEQEHSESADLRQGESGPYPESVYGSGKTSMKIRSVFLEKAAKLWKNDLSGNVEESFLKIPGSGSGGGRLPKFNQFFLVQRYVCGKIFVKVCSVVFM